MHNQSKLKSGVAAGLCGLTLLGATLMPAPAEAGQRTWATIGKVLTGVVVANVIMDTVDSPARHRTSLARSEIIHHHYPVTYPSSTVIIRERVELVPVPARGRYRTYGRPHNYHGRPTGHSRYQPMAKPLVRYHGHNRRVVQPAVPGHIAHVEIYRNGRWIRISTHPSIW